MRRDHFAVGERAIQITTMIDGLACDESGRSHIGHTFALLDEDGHVACDTEYQEMSCDCKDGLAVLRMGFPVDGVVEPGLYNLKIQVQDLVSKESCAQSVPIQFLKKELAVRKVFWGVRGVEPTRQSGVFSRGQVATLFVDITGCSIKDAVCRLKVRARYVNLDAESHSDVSDDVTVEAEDEKPPVTIQLELATDLPETGRFVLEYSVEDLNSGNSESISVPFCVYEPLDITEL